MNEYDTGTTLDPVAMQSFCLIIQNNGGVIQHRIVGEVNGATASSFASKVNGSSATFANTPTVSSVVGFTSGVGVDSTGSHRLCFDTAAQVDADFDAMAVLEYQDIGTALGLLPRNLSVNVNGTNQNRFAVSIFNGTTGAPFQINTTNIPSTKLIRVRVRARLA